MSNLNFPRYVSKTVTSRAYVVYNGSNFAEVSAFVTLNRFRLYNNLNYDTVFIDDKLNLKWSNNLGPPSFLPLPIGSYLVQESYDLALYTKEEFYTKYVDVKDYNVDIEVKEKNIINLNNFVAYYKGTNKIFHNKVYRTFKSFLQLVSRSKEAEKIFGWPDKASVEDKTTMLMQTFDFMPVMLNKIDKEKK